MKMIIQVLLAFFLVAQGQSLRKRKESLHERVQSFMELTSTSSVASLNRWSYGKYLKASPRNYSVVMMFTALSEERKCSVCLEAFKEYELVIESYRSSPVYSNRLFFVKIDFDEAAEVFQQLGVDHVPVIMHFPQKGKPKNRDKMDLDRTGFRAEAIVKWVGDRTGIQIRIRRPQPYRRIVSFFLLLALVLSCVFLFSQRKWSVLHDYRLWGFAAIVFCLLMSSGLMWNHIRNPPWLMRSPRGERDFISRSNHGQFKGETGIIMLIYGALSLGMILMIEAAMDARRLTRKGCVLSLLGFFLFAGSFSLIVSIFCLKSPWYPYGVPLY